MSNHNEEESRNSFIERYANGHIPWDAQLPPPEVIALTESLPAGNGLDLGCGHGRSAIYLAKHGWTMTGIDFVPAAIDGAIQRAAAENVADQIAFQVGSVLKLDHLTGPYDLAIDVGCFHIFGVAGRMTYAHQLSRLLRPGGLFLLFAFLEADDAETTPQSRPREEDIMWAFDSNFELMHYERGATQMEDHPVRHSGWFWWQKRSG